MVYMPSAVYISVFNTDGPPPVKPPNRWPALPPGRTAYSGGDVGKRAPDQPTVPSGVVTSSPAGRSAVSMVSLTSLTSVWASAGNAAHSAPAARQAATLRRHGVPWEVQEDGMRISSKAMGWGRACAGPGQNVIDKVAVAVRPGPTK